MASTGVSIRPTRSFDTLSDHFLWRDLGRCRSIICKASGSVYAKNVTLDGDVFRNTGFIFADKITVNADSLSWHDAKHWALTYCEQIQEGGFMSAADYAFNGEKIMCES